MGDYDMYHGYNQNKKLKEEIALLKTKISRLQLFEDEIMREIGCVSKCHGSGIPVDQAIKRAGEVWNSWSQSKKTYFVKMEQKPISVCGVDCSEGQKINNFKRGLERCNIDIRRFDFPE
tara:strand:- start:64 stop:420 length:357 start_codon:yes stop_codon:yes gene_type:complete